MGRIILVTAGARSGKSSFAESLFKGEKDVVYIATSKIYDDEMRDRGKIHRVSRSKEWRTFEGIYDLDWAVKDEKFYPQDCLTVLTSNIMFDLSAECAAKFILLYAAY
jgi:adenosylcobinamide kinase/adenosylcobinamide-phosphate guanylyltransferase